MNHSILWGTAGKLFCYLTCWGQLNFSVAHNTKQAIFQHWDPVFSQNHLDWKLQEARLWKSDNPRSWLSSMVSWNTTITKTDWLQKLILFFSSWQLAPKFRGWGRSPIFYNWFVQPGFYMNWDQCRIHLCSWGIFPNLIGRIVIGVGKIFFGFVGDYAEIPLDLDLL